MSLIMMISATLCAMKLIVRRGAANPEYEMEMKLGGKPYRANTSMASMYKRSRAAMDKQARISLKILKRCILPLWLADAKDIELLEVRGEVLMPKAGFRAPQSFGGRKGRKNLRQSTQCRSRKFAANPTLR